MNLFINKRVKIVWFVLPHFFIDSLPIKYLRLHFLNYLYIESSLASTHYTYTLSFNHIYFG